VSGFEGDETWMEIGMKRIRRIRGKKRKTMREVMGLENKSKEGRSKKGQRRIGDENGVMRR
jgi:hypothetical protein